MTEPGNLSRGLLLAALALVGPAKTADAGPLLLSLHGNTWGSLASVDVLFSYDATVGRVDLELTNTSSGLRWLAGDPQLTGFAFNAPTSVTGVNGFTSSIAGWASAFGANRVNTPGRFGLFDTAALTGRAFEGGHPPAGLGRGDTAPFSFTFSGSNLDREVPSASVPEPWTLMLTGLGLFGVAALARRRA